MTGFVSSWRTGMFLEASEGSGLMMVSSEANRTSFLRKDFVGTV